MARYVRSPFQTTNVSTLTTLMDWTDLSMYPTITPLLINDDITNNVTLIIETTDDPGGSKKPDVQKREILIAAGKQGSEDIKNLRKFWRISAQTDSPGFPVVSTRWSIVCESRY